MACRLRFGNRIGGRLRIPRDTRETPTSVEPGVVHLLQDFCAGTEPSTVAYRKSGGRYLQRGQYIGHPSHKQNSLAP